MHSLTSAARFITNNTPTAKPELWSALPFCLLRNIHQRVRRPTGAKTVTLHRGVKIRIDVATEIGRTIHLYRCWEYPLTRLLQAVVKAEMTFLDVGANIGYFSLVAANLGGKVHAFEPVRQLFDELQHNISLNKYLQIAAYPFAVTSVAGDSSFYVVNGANTGLSSLLASSGGQRTMVRGITLDTFCYEHHLNKVHVVKVDVEGAESQVFEGARTLLGRIDAPDIVFECHPGASADKILKDHGYKIFALRKQRCYEATNLFASKRELDSDTLSQLRLL